MSESLISLACQINDLISVALRPALDEQGITSASFAILSSVKAADGRETQAEIGRRLGLSRATVSEAVTALVAQDLILRKPSDHDGRAVTLVLTGKGHQKVNAVLKRMQEAEAEVTARLMDREVTSTAKVLKKLIYGLERL
jgi:DNA-binding MarR family transcriptional regulator